VAFDALTRGQRIVLATANQGKLKEFQSLLGESWVLIPQSTLGITAIDETGVSFTENALMKARHAAAAANLPAIADDSGLEVDALDGEPGVRSARFAEPAEGDINVANNIKLLARMAAVAPTNRSARFRCVLAFVRDADDPAPIIADGVWEGQIALSPLGDNGFGYDPVFIDTQSGLTGGQLDATEKNLRSHRGMAVRRLRRCLEALTRENDH
jgi:XTP/dITP diphosphohydrolase